MLATVGNLRVQSPVAQGGVTAIGFHGSEDGALVLKPVARSRTRACSPGCGAVSPARRAAASPGTSSPGGPLRTLDVGAVAGTDVYSPIDGTVVAIRDQVVSGRTSAPRSSCGRRRRPHSSSRSQNVSPDPALSVGANVAAGSSKLGTVTTSARFEHQALEHYAADGGNNVAIQVFPSATLGVP